MNKRALVASVAAFGAVLGLTAFAVHTGQAAAPAPASGKADNFRLTSADRQSYELYRMKDDQAVVLVGQANDCAPLRQQAAAINGLASDKVDVLLINSNLKDPRDAVAAEADKAGYKVPVLMDEEQLVGEQLGLAHAGEAVILDPKTWSVAWRGPVADARSALADVQAGRTPAMGKPVATCTVAFPARAKQAQFAQISYAREIAPIIKDKCVECHEPGGIGPMPLTSYEKVKGFAPMIREVVRTQRMPPWHADPHVNHFEEDASLSPDQIKTLVHWVEAGSPRGEGDDPLAKVAFQAAEWPLGKPDMIIDVPAYTIPANGVVAYQRPFAPYPGTEGKWLRASTFKIDQRQAVHHILTGYIADPPKTGNYASESLWGTTFGTFAVGTNPTVMPKDVGAYVPPGGAVGFQNHYTPFGKEVTAHSQLGLYFYKTPPKMVMRTNTIIDASIQLPPGVERHKEVAYMTFPSDAILYGVFLHAHYRGSGAELKAIYPDGKEKLLISVPRYDFNWQRDYSFATPEKIPAGTRVVATYVYDNSKRNPGNPDPTRTVPWGEQSFDEMHYSTMRYRWTDETPNTPEVGKAHDKALLDSRYMGMYDDNLDGRIEKSELKGGTGQMILARFDMLDANKDGALDEKELAAATAALSRGQQRADAH